MTQLKYGINRDVSSSVSSELGICFDIDADVITLGIDVVIGIYFLDRSFEFCNDENLDVIVTGVQYDIIDPTGLPICKSSGITKCYYICIYIKTYA